jgi:hypothetical protein
MFNFATSKRKTENGWKPVLIAIYIVAAQGIETYSEDKTSGLAASSSAAPSSEAQANKDNRGSETSQLGCSRCRFTRSGCNSCRNPLFKGRRATRDA